MSIANWRAKQNHGRFTSAFNHHSLIPLLMVVIWLGFFSETLAQAENYFFYGDGKDDLLMKFSRLDGEDKAKQFKVLFSL